jgi:hypothetical protein
MHSMVKMWGWVVLMSYISIIIFDIIIVIQDLFINVSLFIYIYSKSIISHNYIYFITLYKLYLMALFIYI